MTNFNSSFLMDIPRSIILEPVADDNFVSDVQNLEIFGLDGLLTDNNEHIYNTAADTQSGTTANVEVLNDTSNGPDTNYMEHQTINLNAALNAPVRFQLATSNEASDSRCCSLSSCKCYHKLCNKIEWLHKKIFNEFNSIRGEIMTNRQMFLDNMTSGQHQRMEQSVVVQEEEKENELDMTEDEVLSFNATFKNVFPVSTSEALVEFNETTDEKFKKFVAAKIEKLQGDDETKTLRKILKSLCDVQCMSQYTWFGTKKKKSFSKLQSVVEMIVRVIESKYPKCDANELLKVVVQQRTKSSAEKVDKMNSQSTSTESARSAPTDDSSNGTLLQSPPSVIQNQALSEETVFGDVSQLVNRQDTAVAGGDQNQ